MQTSGYDGSQFSIGLGDVSVGSAVGGFVSVGDGVGDGMKVGDIVLVGKGIAVIVRVWLGRSLGVDDEGGAKVILQPGVDRGDKRSNARYVAMPINVVPIAPARTRAGRKSLA